MQLPSLRDAKIEGKTVFLRADLDVPLSEIRPFGSAQGENPKSEIRNIEDETRLKASLPTIEYLLKQNAKVIIGGHLGRPSPKFQISNFKYQISNENAEFSLKPVARWFATRLEIGNWKLSALSEAEGEIGNLNGFEGWEIGPNIFLLENLRFYPGEEANDLGFAKNLASLADAYVNDAFAMSHRNHASIVGVTKFLPHFAGLHLEKEVESLTRAMENPKRPLVVIIGGKKLETKLPLVEKMHRIADYVLVGGKIAQETKVLAKVQHEKIVGKKSVLLIADSTEDNLSITENSLNNFLEIIPLGKTIIWNGTMGKINEKLKMKNEKFHEYGDMYHASEQIAKAIIDSRAYSIVGGGDTVEFLNKIGLLNKFLASRPASPSQGGRSGSFASTGGGAMLAFLSGEKLPGIEALIRQ